jgi:hypothetical protein
LIHEPKTLEALFLKLKGKAGGSEVSGTKSSAEGVFKWGRLGMMAFSSRRSREMAICKNFNQGSCSDRLKNTYSRGSQGSGELGPFKVQEALDSLLLGKQMK